MGAQEKVSGLFARIFGSRNDRIVKKLWRFADQVDVFEPAVRALSPEQLRAKTDEFRARLAGGEREEAVMPEAFAVLREASRRAQNHRHFRCQLVGGRVLYQGKVAEMRTGEGKTIVCHLAAYLRVCRSQHVHIVTVNDYLVKRDAEFARPIFELLGITVGYIQAMVDPGGMEGVRQQAYACDITYGTNSEFGFDYLRDNMKMQRAAQVQSPLHYAIVDEVDSILIDEARTPLIISGPAHDDVTKYKWADGLARHLVRRQQELNAQTAARLKEWGDNPPAEYAQLPKFEGAFKRFRIDPHLLTDDEAEAIGHTQLYVVQLERKSIGLTHQGVQVAQDEARIGSFYVGANMDRPHIIEQALRAHVVYERDKDYVVQDREVIIVDEFTGRLMYGRQWSDGLHQAVEAKEGVPVKEETQTMATITIQNFCKLYQCLAGMTGTALTEGEEFMKIYKLDVVAIPTNRPVNRVDHNDKVCRTMEHKYRMIVEEIHEVRRKGRPADPFLLAEVFKVLRPILQRTGHDVAPLDAALAEFSGAEYGDRRVIQLMLDTYDAALGDLARGRPVLVGTTSVENSEKLSKLLEGTYGIEHEVLNAKNHAREAEIVAKAGHRTISARGADKLPLGNVTIATNMAGRGTDIKLEEGVVYPKCKVALEDPAAGDAADIKIEDRLYPPGSTKCCIHCAEYDAATNCAHCFKPKLDPRFPELGRRVCPLNTPCGLHIVGTERHEARRIDNQLRGRSGRQGDPGSSRFFLSLEDLLLKLFMPDWMLKMMERLGFTEGYSLEDRRLSKGIERAQRKVEERNFGIRKHLLEWDEPMDYQRKQFYSARQAILEGTDVRAVIMDILRQATEDAVGRFLDPVYRSRCMAEWCRANLDVNIDPQRLRAEELDELQEAVRTRAKSEARETINTTLGEYIDREADPREWDVGGLADWVQRTYHINVTQNQLRKMDPEEISNWLIEQAEQFYDRVNLDALGGYLEDSYPRTMLAEWCRSKFGIELTAAELKDRPVTQVVALITARLEGNYAQRELTYPIEVCLERSGAVEVGTDNAHVSQTLAGWVNGKYRLNRRPEDFQGREVRAVYDELVDINRQFLIGGKLEAEIDAALAGHTPEEAVHWGRKRFGPAWNERRFRTDGEADLRTRLVDQGREMLRYELSRLEQLVLLRIHDQCWKDHLLEMDHLKQAIMQRPLGGDQTHPQSQYAIEGREFFNQMWSRVRERVTDLIFKVRMGGGPAFDPGTGAPVPRTGPSGTSGPSLTMIKADASGAAFAGAEADQQAAMQAQNVQQKVETIRRQQPKVGRNDPCPCGSGKKYKQCHGR